jgi:hypothetical protein
MFFEYAIDPAIFSDRVKCESFFTSFLLKSQRLISDTPKNWVRLVFNQIDSIPHEQCQPVMKKTLKVHLRRLMNENLISNRSVQSDSNPWLQVVNMQHQHYPYAAIYTPVAVEEPLKCYAFGDLLYKSPECWNALSQCHIERNARALVDIIEPLLAVSKQVHFIDRVIRFTLPTWARYKPVLIELFKNLASANYGDGIAVINIHTSDNHGNFDALLERELLPIMPLGLKVNVFQWPHGEMHDRFILTDVGAINIGHGLDERTENNADLALVSALDFQTYKTERAKISGTPSQKYTILKS